MPNIIKIRISREDIVFIDNILEGYDNLGLVTTLDAAKGEVIIHVTPGTRAEVLDILQHFPKPLEIMEE